MSNPTQNEVSATDGGGKPALRHVRLCALRPLCSQACRSEEGPGTSNEPGQSSRNRPTRESILGPHPNRYGSPTSPETTPDQRFRWSGWVWSPPPESNRRPHPYHESCTHRCADQRSCRSLATVGREVMCSTLRHCSPHGRVPLRQMVMTPTLTRRTSAEGSGQRQVILPDHERGPIQHSRRLL